MYCANRSCNHHCLRQVGPHAGDVGGQGAQVRPHRGDEGVHTPRVRLGPGDLEADGGDVVLVLGVNLIEFQPAVQRNVQQSF